MTKTPEELAEEFSKVNAGTDVGALGCYRQGLYEGYLAGYQEAAPQWIFVKDRLPEIPENGYSNRVLLLGANKFIVIARLEKCVQFVRPLQEALIVETNNGDPIEEFTHWMPLPKAPEEEK